MTERVIDLGRDRLLVRASWGGWMVVPKFNVDVAPGVVRDGLIEPWTTRLVQELVRPGQVIINGGANFGYYAVLASHLTGSGGRVVAIDANPHIIPFLLLTRSWSGMSDRLDIYHRALWDQSGETLRFGFDPQYLGNGRTATVLRPGSAPGVVGERLDDAVWSADTVRNITEPDGRIAAVSQMHVAFDAITTTIDTIVPPDRPVDLIHLDIEGAEAFALLGAQRVIRHSPSLRIITEWDAAQTGANATMEAAYERLLDLLDSERFIVRHVQPRLHDDGALCLSEPLSRHHMRSAAAHGDYVWVRQEQDPWA